MPDRRRHRGPHPQDRALFAPPQVPRLLAATEELSWLLSRGYRSTSALALVGNRHGLTERQRKAVGHCACADAAREGRLARRARLGPGTLSGRPLALDGFNCLITLECLFSGGVVLRGRDSAHRDLASVHRSYRRVLETPEAVRSAGTVIAESGAGPVTWLLDRPVANSGRLRALLTHEAEAAGWSWSVELSPHPDSQLAAFEGVVATSDGAILDRCEAWCDVPGAVLGAGGREAWLVDLGAASLSG